MKIQQLWADAFARRQVPTYVFGGGESGAPTGSDAEAKVFMQMLTLDAAKRLSYDRELNKKKGIRSGSLVNLKPLSCQCLY